MKKFIDRFALLIVITLIFFSPLISYSDDQNAKKLHGVTGFSSRWDSGWIDLTTVTDFSAGDKLRIIVGGTAKKILVRLLQKGQSPDSSAGLVRGIHIVTQGRVVEIVIKTARKNIIQISVHGGSNPWGRFPLGGGNGPATIEAAYVIRNNVSQTQKNPLSNKTDLQKSFNSDDRIVSVISLSEFQKGLLFLLDSMRNDFASIRGNYVLTNEWGYERYRVVNFNLDHSTDSDLWVRPDNSWYFVCSLAKGKAANILNFDKKVTEIKTILNHTWVKKINSANGKTIREFVAKKKNNAIILKLRKNLIWFFLGSYKKENQLNNIKIPISSQPLISEALEFADIADNDFDRVFFTALVADRLKTLYPDQSRELIISAYKIGKNSRVPNVRHAAIILTTPYLTEKKNEKFINEYANALKNIQNNTAKLQVTFSIGIQRLAKFDYEKALKIVTKINNNKVKYMLILAIAGVVAEKDNLEAIKILKTVPKELFDGYKMIFELKDIKKYDDQRRLSVYRDLTEKLDRQKYRLDPQIVYSIYAGIATDSIFHKHHALKAESLLNESIKIAKGLNNPAGRLSGIALSVTMSGNKSRGMKIFDDAINMARNKKMQDPVGAVTALEQIARQMKKFDSEKAYKIFKEAKKDYRIIENAILADQKVMFLSSMATFYFPDQ